MFGFDPPFWEQKVCTGKPGRYVLDISGVLDLPPPSGPIRRPITTLSWSSVMIATTATRGFGLLDDAMFGRYSFLSRIGRSCKVWFQEGRFAAR